MRWLAVALAVMGAACGDDGAPAADAPIPVPDAQVNDAPVDAAPPIPCAGCVLCGSQNDDNQFVEDEQIAGDVVLAFKFRFNLTRTLRYAQVFTGDANGGSQMRVYSSAAADEPETLLGSGSFVLVPGVGWQGAAFDTAVSVVSNTDHWLGWAALDGAQAPRAPMGNAVEFTQSADDGGTWGAVTVTTFKYRLYCDP